MPASNAFKNLNTDTKFLESTKGQIEWGYVIRTHICRQGGIQNFLREIRQRITIVWPCKENGQNQDSNKEITINCNKLQLKVDERDLGDDQEHDGLTTYWQTSWLGRN